MKAVFKNCTLLDGTRDMCVKKGVDISVENGKIVGIGEIKPDSGDEVIDLTGKYLMPGLINLHVHLPAGGKQDRRLTQHQYGRRRKSVPLSHVP